MNSGWESFALWTTGMVLFVLIVPLVTWTAYIELKKRRRRQLVDAPRKIVLAGDQSDAASSCVDHSRSKSKAHRDDDGNLVSECRYCGVPMERAGPKEWRVIG